MPMFGTKRSHKNLKEINKDKDMTKIKEADDFLIKYL